MKGITLVIITNIYEGDNSDYYKIWRKDNNGYYLTWKEGLILVIVTKQEGRG